MKFSLVLCVFVLISVNLVSAIANRKSAAFKTVHKCAKEHGIDMHQVKKYMRGDLDSKSEKNKVS